MDKKFDLFGIVFVLVLALCVSGCAVAFYKTNPEDKEKIVKLSSEVERLKELQRQERQQLSDTMSALQNKLRKEISDKQAKLEMTDKGLVITFLDQVLFDSGKAEIKTEGKEALDKVVNVIVAKGVKQNIGIEGHTDNIPIKYSGWKSNWELSTARATSVLHYLEEIGISPKRLSATGYGEYRPVDTNDTAEGRQNNRRVEIVILPEYTKVMIESAGSK